MVRLRPAVLLLLCLAAPVTAWAPSPAALGSAEDPANPLSAAGAQATCTISTGIATNIGLFWTSPEELTAFAWKVSACAACASTAHVTPKSVSFRMRWFKTCSATAQISIVGALPGNCSGPDTTRVLCGPVTQTISGVGSTTTQYTFALPPGSCVPGGSFVFLRFSGLGDCPNPSLMNPGMAASTAACVPCTQFVIAAHIFPEISEWCGVVGSSKAAWLSLDADCCSATPTQSETWGGLKTIYR